MSIAKVQDVDTYALTSGTSASSHTSSALAHAISAGDFIAVFSLVNSVSAQSTLTDGLGNTYTNVLQVNNGGSQALWVCYSATTGGTPTYTLTCAGNFSFWLLSVSEWSGVGSPADQSASSTSRGNSGTTGATTTANELVLACFGCIAADNTENATTPTGYSVLASIESGTGVHHLFPFSLIVSSTGTQNATSTVGPTTPTSNFNLIATFPAATITDPFPAGYPHPAGVVTTF